MISPPFSRLPHFSGIPNNIDYNITIYHAISYNEVYIKLIYTNGVHIVYDYDEILTEVKKDEQAYPYIVKFIRKIKIEKILNRDISIYKGKVIYKKEYK